MIYGVEQVKHAMSLTCQELAQITETSGYGCEGYRSARCLGMNACQQFVYHVEYIDSTNGNGECQIYIEMLADGTFKMEF